MVVSPDVGGVARARAFAKKLSDAPLAIIDKRRHGHNIAEVISVSNPYLYFVRHRMLHMFIIRSSCIMQFMVMLAEIFIIIN